jgi:hypothetical protein
MELSRVGVRTLKPTPSPQIVRAQLAIEAAKGCDLERARHPVKLEPPFGALGERRALHFAGASTVPRSHARWYRIQIDPHEKTRWSQAEMWVRQLSGLQCPAAYLIHGNESEIKIHIVVDRTDAALAEGSFVGAFAGSLMQCDPGRPTDLSELDDGRIVFNDYYPSRPYWRQMTLPTGLPDSPLRTLVGVLVTLPKSLQGIYQVVFQPTQPSHDWHHRIEVLHDLEYALKRLAEGTVLNRLPQDVPSADRHVVAREVDTKADNDRAIFAAALRVAVAGADPDRAWLRRLAAFTGLLQYGGQQLRWLTERDYADCPGQDTVSRLVTDRITYRHGFIVNAAELTGLVHLPPVDLPPSVQHATHPLLQLSLGHQMTSGAAGVSIGSTRLGSESRPAHIPAHCRMYQVHIIGAHGTGKSTVILNLGVQDCLSGEGIAVIEPHGPLTQDILDRLPLECAERIVHLDFNSRQRVPMFNPLRCVGDGDADRMANDFVTALKKVVDGWGDRLEHLLRAVLRGIARLPNPTLADVTEVLANGPRHKKLQHDVIKHTEDVLLRRFWQSELASYKAAERAPVLHKLSKLLSEEPLASMLTQPHNCVNFIEAMSTGQILLFDLSGLSDGARTVFGSLLIALLRVAALGRLKDAGNRPLRPFHIFVDESHRFVTPAARELLVEGRKFQTSLTLAHQYLEQYTRADVDALSTVGSTLVFRVGEENANRISKWLNSRVDPDVIANLPPHTAIAGVDREVLRVETAKPPPATSASVRAAIRTASDRYHRNAGETLMVEQPRQSTQSPQSPFTGHPEFVYDELD